MVLRIVFIFFGIVLLQGCVLKKKYNAVQQEIVNAEKKLAKIQVQNENLKLQNSKLKDSIERLK